MPSNIIPLHKLPIGSTGIVKNLVAEGLTRRRMMDLGLTPGAKIKTVRISPAGDPKAYLIRGAVLAFRKEESSKVLVYYEGE